MYIKILEKPKNMHMHLKTLNQCYKKIIKDKLRISQESEPKAIQEEDYTQNQFSQKNQGYNIKILRH